MTADKARKQAARRLAAETGQSYTAAARAVRVEHTPPFTWPRCEPGRCLSEQRTRPGEDLADSAMGRCAYCGNSVCFMCGTAPVRDEPFVMCEPCETAALAEYWASQGRERP